MSAVFANEWVQTFLIIIGLVVAFFVWAMLPETEASRQRGVAAAEAKVKSDGQHRQIVCPHCQTKGQVTVKEVSRKQGISGGKATGALITGGWSMLATGLSRKENTREMTCGACGMVWGVV